MRHTAINLSPKMCQNELKSGLIKSSAGDRLFLWKPNPIFFAAMPTKQEVKDVIMKTLFLHNGRIKEFASGQIIVD